MKLTAHQFSFGISLLFHAVVFGVLAVTGVAWHEPAMQHEESRVTLTLVASPEGAVPSQTTIQTVTPVAPPIPTVLRETKHIETPVPVEAIKSVAEAKMQPPPTEQRPTEIQGDGMSSTPGRDSTTQQAQPGIQATPNYLKNPEPMYPVLARRRHQQGLVLLTVKVTAQGRAAEVVLKQSSGFPLLDEAAVQAVRSWAFQPARIGSVAVESQIEAPVRFTLIP